MLARQTSIAHEIVEELKQMGELMGINVDGKVEIGTAESKIIEVARLQHYDLIILGTNVRPGSETLYLGPKI
jgi:nucleotide-binding universal stress UspA family protein